VNWFTCFEDLRCHKSGLTLCDTEDFFGNRSHVNWFTCFEDLRCHSGLTLCDTAGL